MRLQCTKYHNSEIIKFLEVTLPILAIIGFAIYVSIIGIRFLKNFPEKTTKKLKHEIKHFPLFLIFVYTPKLVKYIVRMISLTNKSEEERRQFTVNKWLFLIEKICMGLMGCYVCFIFIWKRKGFQVKKFFKKKNIFENPSDEDIVNFSYLN